MEPLGESSVHMPLGRRDDGDGGADMTLDVCPPSVREQGLSPRERGE